MEIYVIKTIEQQANVSASHPLRQFLVALTIADRFNVRDLFWKTLLQGVQNPQSANASANIAVRVWVETRLSQLGPNSVNAELSTGLGNNGTWDNLGLLSISENAIGQPLTPQLKADLARALNTFGALWIEKLIVDLQTETANG